jgi:hypothetical protein
MTSPASPPSELPSVIWGNYLFTGLTAVGGIVAFLYQCWKDRSEKAKAKQDAAIAALNALPTPLLLVTQNVFLPEAAGARVRSRFVYNPPQIHLQNLHACFCAVARRYSNRAATHSNLI